MDYERKCIATGNPCGTDPVNSVNKPRDCLSASFNGKCVHNIIESLKKKIVSGFYGEEAPHFTQGLPVNELQDVLTADEANGLVGSIKLWRETAMQNQRNTEYYRGLVEDVGKMLGPDAYISDDGSIQEDVLCAKVPELVRKKLQGG